LVGFLKTEYCGLYGIDGTRDADRIFIETVDMDDVIERGFLLNFGR